MNIPKIMLTTLLATSVLCAMNHQHLSYAVQSGNLALVQHLIEQRADINAPGSHYNGAPLSTAACYGYTDIAQLLIDKQADVNAQSDYCGLTALIHAASHGHTHIAQLLIASQANVNAQSDNRSTALSSAACFGRIDITKALIHAQADLSIEDRSGNTAFQLAKQHNRITIVQMIAQEYLVRKETMRLLETALALCVIRAHEPTSVLSLIPNELLLLILEQIAPDGFKRLLKRN
jgi:ankyrin repeat protein